MKISHTKALGEIPRLARRLLPEEAASRAENVRVETGILSTWAPYKELVLLSQGQTIKSVYRYRETWYDWAKDVDVVRTVLDQDPYDRRYISGDGKPRILFVKSHDLYTSSGEIILGPDGEDLTTEPVSYYLYLAVPAPGSKPTLAKSGSVGSDPVTYTYVWTWVTDLGEEGQPCEAATIEDVTDTESITLSDFPSKPDDERLINTLRIYRLQDDLSAEFFFCKDLTYDASGDVVDPDTETVITEWTDDVAAADLGEVIPSESWSEPPDDLQGLVSHPGGWFAGFAGNTVHMSEPWYPHAWPYSVTLPSQVVGLAVTGNTILVLTDEFPQLIVGSHPSSVNVSEVATPLPCVSKRSIAKTHGGAVFASASGLAFGGADPGSWQLITDGVIERSSVLDRTTWEDFYPETIHGYVYDGKYYGFYHSSIENDRYLGKGFAFDLTQPAETFSRLNFYAYAGFQDFSHNTVYLAIKNERGQNVLVQWEAGETGNNLGLLWKSKEYVFPSGVNFGAAKITAQWPTSQIREDILSENQSMIDSGNVEGAIGKTLVGGVVAIGGTDLNELPKLSGAVVLKIIENNEVVFTKKVFSDAPFRLPGGRKYHNFQYQVESMVPITSRTIAESMAEI